MILSACQRWASCSIRIINPIDFSDGRRLPRRRGRSKWVRHAPQTGCEDFGPNLLILREVGS